MSKNKNNQPIWSTRIKKSSVNLFKKIGGSLKVDKRLFNEDIEASIVHVEMLFKQKIINFKIKNKIVWGLNRIKNEIIKKKFPFDEKLEDIHMNIEARLKAGQSLQLPDEQERAVYVVDGELQAHVGDT